MHSSETYFLAFVQVTPFPGAEDAVVGAGGVACVLAGVGLDLSAALTPAQTWGLVTGRGTERLATSATTLTTLTAAVDRPSGEERVSATSTTVNGKGASTCDLSELNRPREEEAGAVVAAGGPIDAAEDLDVSGDEKLPAVGRTYGFSRLCPDGQPTPSYLCLRNHHYAVQAFTQNSSM